VFFEFVADQCPKADVCPFIARGDCGCYQVFHEPVKKCIVPGKTRPCKLVKGGILTRIFSLVNVIIKGSTLIDWKPGESVRTHVGGREVRLTFVDHPGGDPRAARKLEGLAARSGVSQKGSGIGKAYYNEKFGRLCVDVASNVPDPLGEMGRAKARGDVEQQTTHVNQPYKMRKPARRAK
jgi:hypothetical protein